MQVDDDKTYRERVVRLVDLIPEDGILDGFKFYDCQIKGPLIVVGENSTMDNCNLGGPDADALLWEIPLSRTRVVGAVLLRGCVFEGCEFRNIGFAGPPAFVKQMRESAA